MCSFKVDLCENARLQMVQLNGFSPLAINFLKLFNVKETETDNYGVEKYYLYAHENGSEER